MKGYLVSIKFKGTYDKQLNANSYSEAKELAENMFYYELYNNYNVELKDIEVYEL